MNYFFTGQIRDLINQYLIEANSGQYDYVKALAEFSSKDESALTFKKGEIIAVVPKHDAYTEKVSNTRYNEIWLGKKISRTYKNVNYT